MSYIEAQQDGITSRRMRSGSTAYYPPCQFCKEPVFSWSYRRDVRYTCKACRLLRKPRDKYPVMT